MATSNDARQFLKVVLELPHDQRVERMKKEAFQASSRMSGASDYDYYAFASQTEFWNGIRYLYDAAGICGDDELADIDMDKTYPRFEDYGWAVYHITRLNHGIFGDVESMIFRGLDASNFATPEDAEKAAKKCTELGFNHDSAKYVGYAGFKPIAIVKGGLFFNEKAEYGWDILSSFCLRKIKEGKKVVLRICGCRGTGEITQVDVFYTI